VKDTLTVRGEKKTISPTFSWWAALVRKSGIPAAQAWQHAVPLAMKRWKYRLSRLHKLRENIGGHEIPEEALLLIFPFNRPPESTRCTCKQPRRQRRITYGSLV
jgi:hypothetical protein